MLNAQGKTVLNGLLSEPIQFFFFTYIAVSKTPVNVRSLIEQSGLQPEAARDAIRTLQTLGHLTEDFEISPALLDPRMPVGKRREEATEIVDHYLNHFRRSGNRQLAIDHVVDLMRTGWTKARLMTCMVGLNRDCKGDLEYVPGVVKFFDPEEALFSRYEKIGARSPVSSAPLPPEVMAMQKARGLDN